MFRGYDLQMGSFLCFYNKIIFYDFMFLFCLVTCKVILDIVQDYDCFHLNQRYSVNLRIVQMLFCCPAFFIYFFF